MKQFLWIIVILVFLGTNNESYADWLSDAKSLFNKKEPPIFLKCTGSIFSGGIYRLDPSDKKVSWVEDFTGRQFKFVMDTILYSERIIKASFTFKALTKLIDRFEPGETESKLSEIKASLIKSFKDLDISEQEKERRAKIFIEILFKNKTIVELDRFSGEVKWTTKGLKALPADLFPNSRTQKDEVEEGQCVKLENKKF
jgi:hypothetical protein